MNSVTELLEQSQQSRLFFILSGEHDSLPAAEVKAIIESEGFHYSSATSSYRLLTLTAPSKSLRKVSERSLMYDWCGIRLGECDTGEREILNFVKNQPLEELTKGSRSFAVRSARIGGAATAVRRVNLERDVGAIVKESVPRLTVQLTDPDLTFACILYGSRFLFGLSGFRKPSGLMAPRRPRKRPVFHPSTMPPKIARCMVNLARATPSSTFADPFCGVGGILIEAAVIGCNVLGIDASNRMLRGARRNLKYYGLDTLGFVNADARAPPYRGGLDAIATDPPYGRGSSTMGVKMSTLIMEFLEGAPHLLRKGGHLCISAPVEVDVERYACDSGFTVKESHLARVHRSLTRRFTVLQNA
jgi:tRNA (guanine10-N2)-dimethyltransferase